MDRVLSLQGLETVRLAFVLCGYDEDGFSDFSQTRVCTVGSEWSCFA